MEALGRSCRRMESKPGCESEAQSPDNYQEETVDTSCLDVTAERLEQLTKGMEVLLSNVEQLRSQCSHQATELMCAATNLRQQQDKLKECYSDLAREMEDMIDSVDELFGTKSAFEAKEKQTQKLSRQL